MSIKIRCNLCNEVCGVRQQLVVRLMKGATFSLLATCRKCNQPPPKPSKDFDVNNLREMFGMN